MTALLAQSARRPLVSFAIRNPQKWGYWIFYVAPTKGGGGGPDISIIIRGIFCVSFFLLLSLNLTSVPLVGESGIVGKSPGIVPESIGSILGDDP